MSEAAAMLIEPGKSFFRVFRRGAVFHGDEFFSNAHIGSCASNTIQNSNTNLSQKRRTGVSDPHVRFYASGWR